MTVLISIQPDSGLAIAKCSGILRRSDAQDGAAALWSAPGWNGRASVWDFREGRFELTSSDIRQIAAFVTRNQPDPPPERVAFVTPGDLDFGLARMFEVFREEPRTEFRVFRDYEEALHWARAASRGSAEKGTARGIHERDPGNR